MSKGLFFHNDSECVQTCIRLRWNNNSYGNFSSYRAHQSRSGWCRYCPAHMPIPKLNIGTPQALWYDSRGLVPHIDDDCPAVLFVEIKPILRSASWLQIEAIPKMHLTLNGCVAIRFKIYASSRPGGTPLLNRIGACWTHQSLKLRSEIPHLSGGALKRYLLFLR